MCDVLVGSKADLASPEQLAAFERWAQELYPPKAQVGGDEHHVLAAIGFRLALSVHGPYMALYSVMASGG